VNYSAVFFQVCDHKTTLAFSDAYVWKHLILYVDVYGQILYITMSIMSASHMKIGTDQTIIDPSLFTVFEKWSKQVEEGRIVGWILQKHLPLKEKWHRCLTTVSKKE
jgi:hypothetical protein